MRSDCRKRQKDLALTEGRPVAVATTANARQSTSYTITPQLGALPRVAQSTLMSLLLATPLNRMRVAQLRGVEGATGSLSTFSLHDRRSVSIQYNEADVKFPKVTASADLVIGARRVLAATKRLMEQTGTFLCPVRRGAKHRASTPFT